MAAQSKLECLPVEITNHILSYLEQPRSRLPGLTERQSEFDCPKHDKEAAKDRYALPTTPPDAERFAVDCFSLADLQHPLNALALTSRRCRELVESHCAHLVKSCNKFNLPFVHFETHGSHAVYPDLSGIVYRRLFLQLASRPCIYCTGVLSRYPHKSNVRALAGCEDCFLAQAYKPWEVERFYHIDGLKELVARGILRATRGYEWFLRIDVEALALRRYGTKKYHEGTTAYLDDENKPCLICLEAGISRNHIKKLRQRLKKQMRELGQDHFA